MPRLTSTFTGLEKKDEETADQQWELHWPRQITHTNMVTPKGLKLKMDHQGFSDEMCLRTVNGLPTNSL